MIKLIEKTNHLLFSFALFTLGIIILVGEVPLFKSAVNIILFLMLAISLKESIGTLFHKNKDKWYESIIDFVFLLILFIYQDISLAIVPMVFGLYLIINGLVKLVSYILLKLDQASHSFPTLLLSILFLIVGGLLLFAPLLHLKATLIILGIYCLLLGITYWSDFLDIVKPNRHRFFGRKIRVTLPAFIDAFLPYNVMNHINHLFNNKKEPIVLEEKKAEVEPDLEIFIHVSNEGSTGKFGHVDLYFDGDLYSYGGYDKNNRILCGSIGSGVLFQAEKEKYISFCIRHSKKTLFGFGLTLTQKQKEKIRKKLKEIKENSIFWEPTLPADERAGKEIHMDNYEDYANCLYLATHAKFYKLKKGKYRSYFILGTNCVSWIDSIIGPAGTDILKLNGIITPGTYYEYLNNEFMKKGSNVIRKTIYNNLYLEKKEKKMEYILIQYPNCTTCKKAKLWLDTHSISYELRNIVLENPDQHELINWITKSELPIQKFFNTSGLYYKQMNLKEKLKEMTSEEKTELLATNGMLIKRPLLIGENQVLVGFHEKEWKEKL